jgi:hypothetical protein
MFTPGSSPTEKRKSGNGESRKQKSRDADLLKMVRIADAAGSVKE